MLSGVTLQSTHLGLHMIIGGKRVFKTIAHDSFAEGCASFLPVVHL